ncbi:MAG TPA: PEGA domain-containing protein [Candidatus Sulfotelmatobacter sp.]|nr:PEGA domain-containing protein [Candidatus Sulfotelmatobacter sp.]
MPTKIGHFEILSELSKSPTSAVYKANDPENGQTIALKAIQLQAFGEAASALEQALVAEAESTKVLSNPNITNVFGAGEIEGQFCAAMDYVQGNSIATMLARKEGFSIWDLLDIGRQLCSGFEHAKSHNIVHYSLEPSKIMCGWDGTVKILGFGVSSVGNFLQHVPEGIPSVLHYMSPEQVQGQPTDARSNLFSLGAMLYEMVTERKPFNVDDAESVRRSILEDTPVAPLHVNPKVHPLLSDLIMKALMKDPGQRYQSGKQLLDDLENCKEARPATPNKLQSPKAPAAPVKANAVAQAKFAGSAGPAKPVENRVSAVRAPSTQAQPVSSKPPKVAAAAAGIGNIAASAKVEHTSFHGNQNLDDSAVHSGSVSSAVSDEPQIQTFDSQAAAAPKIAVDPLMAEGATAASSGTSFSEISELPPLKEVYIAPPPPPPAEPEELAGPVVMPLRPSRKADAKPKVQPREVAQKAIKEIKGVPPKLMLYAIAAAVILILVIGVGVSLYVHSLNSDDDSGGKRPAAVAQTPAQPEASQPAPQNSPAPAPAASQSQDSADQQAAAAPEAAVPEAQPVAPSKTRNGRKRAAVPAIMPGQLAIDSMPAGAQVQLDGQTDASWVTPLALANLQPGQHSISVSKPGYSTDSRTVNVTAGNRATAVVHLVKLMATLVVKSDPPGANIYVDGRDTSTKTPAQVSVDKGQHVVLVRMPGYLDETMNAQFALGQTSSFSPTLRPLGNTDNLRTVGKMSKLFGQKGGQGTVSIHTQPKGAQIAINQHLVEKPSPADVLLDPGNYVIDITISGYAPIHKVISVEKGSKVVVDEVMQPQ